MATSETGLESITKMFTLSDRALHFKALLNVLDPGLCVADGSERESFSGGGFCDARAVEKPSASAILLEMIARFQPVENEVVWTALVCRVSSLPHLDLYLWCVRLVFMLFAPQNSPGRSSFLETAHSY